MECKHRLFNDEQFACFSADNCGCSCAVSEQSQFLQSEKCSRTHLFLLQRLLTFFPISDTFLVLMDLFMERFYFHRFWSHFRLIFSSGIYFQTRDAGKGNILNQKLYKLTPNESPFCKTVSVFTNSLPSGSVSSKLTNTEPE